MSRQGPAKRENRLAALASTPTAKRQSKRLQLKQEALDQSKMELETIDKLQWFANRPKNERVGRSGSTEVQCGDLKLLKTGLVTEPILNLWCDYLNSESTNTVIVAPDIFYRYLHGGLDTVRYWTSCTKVKANTVVIIPIANGKLWDLEVLDPVELKAHFFGLSGKQEEAYDLMEAALCLICNCDGVDRIWIENALKFDITFHGHTPSRALVCQYIESCVRTRPMDLEPIPKADMNIQVASIVLRLVNRDMLSLCGGENDLSDGE